MSSSREEAEEDMKCHCLIRSTGKYLNLCGSENCLVFRRGLTNGKLKGLTLIVDAKEDEE